MPAKISASRRPESRLLQSLLPSSLASIIVHGVLVAAMLIAARGCEQGVPADAGGEEFRTIGLVRAPTEVTTDADSESPPTEASEPPQAGEIELAHDADVAVPESSATVDDLLKHSQPLVPNTPITIPKVIGPGAPLPGMDLPSHLIPEAVPRDPGGSFDPGPDATSFMEIADSGQRFVYLIDASGSMHNGGRMELAQSQLLASLRMLEAHQEFQVIFYGEHQVQMRLKGGAKEMYRATLPNINLARDEIENNVESLGGTKHLPALVSALKLKPDVVYFLTDGQDARLTKEDLRTLLKQNSAGARIHVVEFATGASESRHPTWLHWLATKTGGKYRRVQR